MLLKASQYILWIIYHFPIAPSYFDFTFIQLAKNAKEVFYISYFDFTFIRFARSPAEKNARENISTMRKDWYTFPPSAKDAVF